MKRLLVIFTLLIASFGAYANDKATVEKTLNNFLANKIQNDFQNHNNFWASELIYTSSDGLRFDKAYIMAGFKGNESNAPSPEAPVYWAEETDIRLYGDIAIVAFKLMHKENKTAKEIKQTYFNTGTLINRDGKWQAIAWQATKIPQQ